MSANVPIRTEQNSAAGSELEPAHKASNPPEPLRPRFPGRWLVRLACLALVLGLAVAGAWFWQKQYRQHAWQQIQSALSRHDLQDAAVLLSRYRQLQPDDPNAWFLSGRTARRLGQVAEAEAFLERCQQLGGVTEATELEWDLLRVQQGKFEGIDTRLRMTIGPDHPDSVMVLEALARGYLKRERIKDAFQACELWLAREPEHPRPALWRGWIRERLNHLDNALLDYQQAVKYAPDDPETRLALGNLLAKMRKPAEAAVQFQHILERAPTHPEALLGLAGCHIDGGRPAEAVPLLDRALANQPDSPLGLMLRGRAAMEQGAFAEAEPWLQRAAAADPSSAEAMHALVHCLRAQDKHAEADKWTARVESLLADLRRLDELIRTIGRQPNDARPRHDAGVIALRIGRLQQGLGWLNDALQAQGDHRSTHAVLADYYQQIGDQALANHHRRLAENP